MLNDVNASHDLEFSCACEMVKGTLCRAGPKAGDHVVCHCTDCQAFARRLGAQGRVLDEAGGTALFQGRCASMKLRQGRDLLACFHLTNKPTLRWYASCCRTPMFNTYANGSIPYITALVANCDPERRNGILGPVIGHLFLDEATGDVSGLPRLSMGRLMSRFFFRMVADIVSGDRKRSELFDAGTLEPISPPERLTA